MTDKYYSHKKQHTKDNNITDFLKKGVSLLEQLSENKLSEILQGSRRK